MEDIYAKSNHAIMCEIGRRFKQYRLALRLTQKEISEKSGLSIQTIVRFEKGDICSIKMDSFMALLRVIERLDNMVEVIPEIVESLYAKPKKTRVPQRVKKRKDEK